MNCHIVTPSKGIGNIQIGMSKTEIDNMFNPKYTEEEKINHLVFNCEEKTNLLSVRYNNSMFVVLYDSSNTAIEISAAIDFFEDEPLILYDMDLSRSKAEDIILTLRNYASFTYDGDDEDLSTTYIFKDLGITLWRESGFHSKLLNDNEFLSMSLEDQEYEKRFMFFNSISIS